MSYLGKISAVVTANTFEYRRGLNEAAADTKRFASTVESNIKRASTDAQRSFNAILLPIQKFEASLKAAASQKLSFAGFSAAVRTVEELKQRLGELKPAQVSVVLKQSGFNKLDDLRDSLREFSNRDLRIIADVGGEEKVRALANEIRPLTADNLLVKMKVSDAELTSLIAKLDRISVAQINATIKVANQQALDAAVLKMQQLFSASEQLAKPLAAAASEMNGLSSNVVAAFLPAMSQVQNSVEELRGRIEAGAKIGTKEFANLEARVRSTVAAVKELSEASNLVKSIGTGAGLKFSAPAQFDALTRASAASKQAEGLSGEASAQFGIGKKTARVNQEAVRLEELLARRRSVPEGGDTSKIDSYIEAKTQALDRQVDALQRATKAGQDYDNADAIQAAKAKERADEVAADAQRRAQAASRFLNVDQRESNLMANEGRATRLPAGFLEGAARQRARMELGSAPSEGAVRSMGQLRQAVVSVREQVDTLPDAVRTRFLPAIRDAEQEFIRLRAIGPAATAAEIDNARRRMAALAEESRSASRAMNFSAAFGGGQFGSGLEDIMQARSLQGYAGELGVIQNALGRVTTEARARALPAFYALRDAISDAAENGTLDTDAFRARLTGLRNDAVTAAAAVAGISARRLGADVQRAGDVARGGMDRFSLAAQQAGFAIDDFMSSTGGFDQKLRAVSNNITQLAFILGGTRGLFIGLGAVIGGQVAGALIKWYNEGRTAEDQVKALNEALARQKSLVEDLAQAFESLGDSITRGTFSAAGERANEFGRQMDAIKKKQEEFIRNSIADNDPTVIRERAQQQALKRQIEGSSDAGQIIGLQQQMAESKRREKEAADRAVNAPPPNLGNVQQALRDTFERLARAAVLDAARAGGDQGVNPAEAGVPFRERRDAVPLAGSVAEARGQLQAQVRELSGQIEGGFFTGNQAEAARASLLELQKLLASLEAPFRRELFEAANAIADASRGPAEQIRQAQEDVADAIRRGVPGAAAFQRELDGNAEAMQRAQDQLRDAFKIEDVDKQKEAVDKAQKEIDAVSMEAVNIDNRSREARLGRTRGGERATDALGELQGNANFDNERGGIIGQLRATVDAEIQARRKLDQAIASGDEAARKKAEADLEAAQWASEFAAGVAEAALAMEEALGRLRKIADGALEASTRIADDAQKEFTNNPTKANRQERDRRERELINDREAVGIANAGISHARSEAMGLLEVQALTRSMERLEQERKTLEEDTALNGTDNSPRMAEIEQEQVRLAAERERLLNDATESERAYADAIAQGIAAREQAIREEKELEKRRQKIANPFAPRDFDERMAAADRGEQLAMTERQKAQQTVGQGMEDIRQHFALQAELGNGIIDQRGQKEAMQRFADEQIRGAAPAIVDMAEQVQNSILQGPSRAALNATDASSVQGQSELNRLLRGDDSSKNQNLVELQKQNEKLTQVVDAMKDVAQKMGVVLDL